MIKRTDLLENLDPKRRENGPLIYAINSTFDNEDEIKLLKKQVNYLNKEVARMQTVTTTMCCLTFIFIVVLILSILL